MIYFALYCLLTTFDLLIANRTKANLKHNSLCAFFIAVTYGVFSACLPYDYNDRNVYALLYGTNFNYEWGMSFLKVFSQTEYEYGYAIFCATLRKITSDIRLFFFLSAFISNYCVLTCMIKHGIKFKRCFFLFICTMYPVYTFYACRQMLAVGFISVAYDKLWGQRNIESLCWILLAILFHASASVVLLYWALALLIKDNPSRTKGISIGLCCLVPFIVPIMSFARENIAYFNNKMIGSINVGISSVAVIGKGIPTILIFLTALISIYKLMEYDNKTASMVIITECSAISWLIAVINYWLFRFSIYGILPGILLLEELSRVNIRMKPRKLIYVVILFSMILITWREIYLFFTKLV